MPDEAQFPHVSKELLEALEKLFPERSPFGPTEDLSSLMFHGGKREVVRFMRRKFLEQTKNKSELPNVLVKSS